MTALVIGAAGHLGSLLADELDAFRVDIKPGVESGYYCADVRDAGDLSIAFRDTDPDVVFNFAGVVGRRVAEQAKAQALGVNVLGAGNVARLCFQHHAYLVHISTSEVYGPQVLNAKEDYLLAPNNWYGQTKAMGEAVVQYVLPSRSCVVRPFMLYGETETAGAHRSAMIRFAHAIANGEEFELHRNTARGWFHYSDFVSFLARMPSRTDELPPALNLGHPDIRPVEDLIPLMEAELGKKARYRVVDQPDRMTKVKRPDLTLQTGLGFVPSISLEEGVRRVCGCFTGPQDTSSGET